MKTQIDVRWTKVGDAITGNRCRRMEMDLPIVNREATPDEECFLQSGDGALSYWGESSGVRKYSVEVPGELNEEPSLQQAMISVEKKRAEEKERDAAKKAAEQAEWEEECEAKLRAAELCSDNDLETIGHPYLSMYYGNLTPLPRYGLVFAPGHEERARAIASRITELQARAKAEEEAEAKAKRDATAARAIKEREELVTLARPILSSEQVERLDAGVLAEKDIRDAIRDALLPEALGGLLPYERIEEDDLDEGCPEDEHDLSVDVVEVATYSAAQWAARKAAIVALGERAQGATLTLKRHDGTCDRSHCSASCSRHSMTIRLQLGAVSTSRAYGMPD